MPENTAPHDDRGAPDSKGPHAEREPAPMGFPIVGIVVIHRIKVVRQHNAVFRVDRLQPRERILGGAAGRPVHLVKIGLGTDFQIGRFGSHEEDVAVAARMDLDALEHSPERFVDRSAKEVFTRVKLTKTVNHECALRFENSSDPLEGFAAHKV